MNKNNLPGIVEMDTTDEYRGMDEFQALVNRADNFELRRAVERLREGLFDPLYVRLFTTGRAKLKKVFDQGVMDLDRNKPSHLCICGAYGQGKSHSLNYIHQQALDDNFVVSYINLDPRQVPFHDFKGVYRALMAGMQFPNGQALQQHDKQQYDKQQNDGDAKRTQQHTSFALAWKTFAAQWMTKPENSNKTCRDLIPEQIPHLFKAVLTAMAQKNMSIPPQKRKLKKHCRFKPREFSWILKNVLMGKTIPAWRLRAVFYYRQVSFYKENSLVCKGEDQYLALVQGMAELFQRMGFKGWIVLFDEGEAIVQTRITSRSKSYRLLDKIFYPAAPPRGFYPVFAFTNDFFTCLADEAYDRMKIVKKGKNGTPPVQLSYFDKNYSRAWKNINIHALHDLSSQEWKILIHQLIIVHGRAYQWEPPSGVLIDQINRELARLSGVEARLKLKFMVNHLDLAQQSLMNI